MKFENLANDIKSGRDIFQKLTRIALPGKIHLFLSFWCKWNVDALSFGNEPVMAQKEQNCVVLGPLSESGILSPTEPYILFILFIRP